MTEPSPPSIAPEAPPAAAPTPSSTLSAATPAKHAETVGKPPTFVFFGVVAAISLILDVASKAWAEITLSKRSFLDPSIVLIKDHLQFTLAYNKGGAWGLLQNASENIRKPFFLLVSVLAIAFIVSLYGRLMPGQRALKWGLPLVLGGALGNLSDRITRSSVIDFIDYRADWIESMNTFVARYVSRWSVTDHWPTFNVADIAICIGVGLMAVDMFTSRRHAPTHTEPPAPPLRAGDSVAESKPPAAG
jgi:signal peptidase II